MQDCFGSHDLQQLKEVLSKMSEEKCNYYINQCIMAGLLALNDEEEKQINDENDTQDGEKITS